jgi:ankyrin repeat protein
MKSALWRLLLSVLTRNGCATFVYSPLSWSLDGYSMVARIAKSILSSWCIDKKCVDDVVDDYGYRIFMVAARHGHTSVVELLLADPRVDKASIDHVCTRGSTALMLAASNGHTSVVEHLLADPRVDRSSIDHADGFGWTALMRAAKKGNTSVVELLVADSRVDKASIDHVDGYGWTALMVAAQHGHTSIIELLLADPRVHKASIDHANNNGNTALMVAAEHGHISIAELLLADPRVDTCSINRTDIAGHTALWHAARYGYFRLATLLMSDARTSWDSIVQLTADRRTMKRRDEILPRIIAELTRRQMCVIFPSANRVLWPGPVQSDAESGDAKASGLDADDDDAREESDFVEPQCALITSFFQSRVFDVNVLRIIRQYTTYTCSKMETYTDFDSDYDSDSYY